MRLLFLILCLVHTLSHAQPVTPSDWGLKRFTLRDKSLGEIGFYIDTTNLNQKAPLLVHVNGSGGYPLCIYAQGDSSARVSLTFDRYGMNQFKDKYHFILLDKPGLNFCDTIRSNEKDFSKILENYSPPEYYTKTLSLDWRANAVKAVITYILKKGFYDNSRIILWGYSEGGQVVPKITAEDKRITHCVAIVGSGLNQLYDPMMTIRVRVEKGELTHAQGQQEMDQLLSDYREIFKDPNSTTKMFWGHSYKRWSSFGKETTLESLEKITVPLYMVVGTADNNSPIYGLDYIPLEFIRLGKTNLTYDVCTGCDHGLTIIEPGNSLRGKNLYPEYLSKIQQWIEQ